MIRKAQVKDIEAIFDMDLMYMKEMEPEHVDRWASGRDMVIRNYLQVIDNIYVYDDGQILGFSYWSLHQGPCVNSIYTLKSARGKGIGQKLLKAIEDDISQKGYRTMTLSTLENNPARYLFDKMAYKQVQVSGGWIFYEKDL